MSTENDVVTDPSKQYNWLVKRGDLRFWKDSSKLMIEIDTKGSESCLLTVQDALDVYSILKQFGQVIFEEQSNQIAYEKKYVQLAENSFSWPIDNQELKIFLNNESDYLQITYNGEGPIALDVGLISEIAQAIGIIIRNATSEKS